MINQEISIILREIARLLEINGEKSVFKIRAYQKAAFILENFPQTVEEIYKKDGLKGLEKMKGIGKSIASKIEEYLKKGKIKYFEELKNETAIQQIITHFFKTKGISLDELKKSSRKKSIVYSRYTKPAKELIELAGSIEKAEQAIDKVASWATSRGLDYAIETVFKKWLEIDELKPKEIVKKPFYEGLPMIWSETKKKWFVISSAGEWLEFCDKEEKMEWRLQSKI